MKKFKGIVFFLMLILVVFSFTSCEEEESVTGITELTIEDLSDKKFYKETTSGEFELNVWCEKEYETESVNVIIEDEKIISVDFEKTEDFWGNTYISFNVTGLNEGRTSFRFETIDGVVKSDTVEVVVEKNITAINFDDNTDVEFYDWESEQSIEFEVESFSGITNIPDVLSFVSENENVATISYDEEGSWLSDECIIKKVAPGETYVYIQTKDGSVISEKIKVIVPEEETEPETEEPTYIYYEEEKPAGSGITVYVTPYGKKYHYSSACAGENGSARDLDDVKGVYDPCKKCAY